MFSNASKQSLSQFDANVRALKIFIDHLMAEQPKLLAEIKSGNENIGFGEGQSWSLFLMAFRNHVKSFNLSASMNNKHLTGINFWVKYLMNRGYIPRVTFLRTFKEKKKVSATLLDYTSFEKALNDLNKFGVEEEDKKETRLMMESIVSELGEIDPLNIPQQAAAILKKRLHSICKIAQENLDEAKSKRIEGMLTIRRNRYLLPLIDIWIGWRRGDGGKTNPYKAEIKSLTNDQFWGVVLAWCWYRNGGSEPKWRVLKSRTYNLIRNEFQDRGLTISDKAISAAIGCTKEWIGATNVLLIHDLVANVDSVRKIKVNADQRDDYGVNEIHWDKPRGPGAMSLIENDEHVHEPAKIIRQTRKATKFYRLLCGQNHRDCLFLHHHSSKGSSKTNKSETVRPMLPSSPFVLEQIKKIIQEASNNKWTGTGRSIRNSLLLYKGLIGGLIAIKIAAQHSDAKTSKNYASKPAMEMKHQQKMLEFRLWLETLVTINLDDVANKLGIDADSYNVRKEEILGSRFGGLYCLNPLGGIQPGTIKGEVCTKFKNCLTCTQKSNIVFATLDNVLHLLQWRDALDSAKKDGVIDYEKDLGWLFWRVFVDELLQRLKTGGRKYEGLLHEAKLLSVKRINHYFLINFGKEE
jgi:hypothetical protein